MILNNNIIIQMNLEISVIVIEPTLKLGNPNYIVYTIKGQDKEGTFEI